MKENDRLIQLTNWNAEAAVDEALDPPAIPLPDAPIQGELL